MRNKTFVLLKAQLLDQSGLNSFLHEKDQKKKNKAIAFTVSMVLVTLVLVAYCYAIGYGLCTIGLVQVIPGCAFTLTSLLVLFFTLFKAGGVLFAFKDYDMLMALPVKTATVISSRFFLMYGWNALFSLGVMLPMGISYCLYVKPQALFYVMWLIAILAAPLVPMTIATILSAIISAVAARFKHTNTNFRTTYILQNTNKQTCFFFYLTNSLQNFIVILMRTMRKVKPKNIYASPHKSFYFFLRVRCGTYRS